MANWLEETKNNIRSLKEKGYFNNWEKKETDLIDFFIYPGLELPTGWSEKRISIYKENAQKLGVKPPKISFYVYPSMDAGKEIGITPAITMIKNKEIHGHLKQSTGHEPTHILLGEISPSEDLPANGLWAEGICVYLDGTGTDRKKHALSLNPTDEILNAPWTQWRKNFPGNLYPLSGSIVQYCDGKYGWDKILDFVKRLKNYSDNDEVVSPEIFGITYGQLQDNWRTWLKS